MFARLPASGKLTCELQRDYLAAYLDFSSDSTELPNARRVVEKYPSHPVERWNKLFAEVSILSSSGLSVHTLLLYYMAQPLVCAQSIILHVRALFCLPPAAWRCINMLAHCVSLASLVMLLVAAFLLYLTMAWFVRVRTAIPRRSGSNCGKLTASSHLGSRLQTRQGSPAWSSRSKTEKS